MSPSMQQSANAATSARQHGLSTSAANLLAEAGRLLEQADTAAAEAILEQANSLCPDHPEVLRLFAVGRILQGRPAEAIALLRRALAARPEDALLYNNLGSALRANGEMNDSIAAFQNACRLAPTLAAAWFNLGKTQKLLACTEDAHASLERAITLAPGHITARIVYADNLKALGRIDEAANAYRAAVKHRPRSAQAWWGLANLKTLRFDAADTQALEHLSGITDMAAEDRALAMFALAKAYEDQNRHADAWNALEAANGMRRRHKPWDAQAFSHHVDAIAAAFAQSAGHATDDFGNEVIFIVSLPRSGSTLVEQIIAAHADVEGAGELPDLGRVIAAESQRQGRPFPDWVADMKAVDWRRLGEDYLARTARWRTGNARFTDKGLDNWIHLGAAAAMLPGARFVHCERDRLETALSCYRQWFNDGQQFSYALEDIAHYLRDHERLMALWRDRFPDRIYRQTLEALQAEPAAGVRALLAFAALPFDPACLTFHTAVRPVRTASAAQVRNPLQRDTRRSPRYGESLQKLRKALDQP